MSRIVISYRREDSAPYAGRLYDRLAADIGDDHVFMDIDTIPPGADFVDVIETALGRADVLLAIIGERWVDAIDDQGRRRLDNPMDFVRLEVGTALERNIRVIPVLVGGSEMPGVEQLPSALATLSRRNAFELNDTRFHSDVDQLVEFLKEFLQAPNVSLTESPEPSSTDPTPIRGLPDPPPPQNLYDAVRLVEAPSDTPPFEIEAIALEEDTSLVLSADISVRDSKQHPIRLMTELYDEQSKTPGRVVVKDGNPIRLMAIVHDFDQDPSCREEWITSCLEQVFEQCARGTITSLGLECLGTKHGRLATEKFDGLLRSALQSAPPGALRRIWLIGSD